MLNFTIGPVMSWDEILKIGGEQVPYFRTSEFSKLILENESMMLKYAEAPKGSRCLFLTGSGTMGMEATVVNLLTKDDRALIVNGGGFGQRFVDICSLHGIAFDEIKLEVGQPLSLEIIEKYDGSKYSSFIVNQHETSTGVLYDMSLISNFCKKNNLFLIVDAISAFMADEVSMDKWGVDALVISSQKALACAPGISMVTLSLRALERIVPCNNMYMDFKTALTNANRGQTPFTPAVSILLQIHRRLEMVEKRGGVKGEILKVANIAKVFRDMIKNLPVREVSLAPSNAITALSPTNGMSAKLICNQMRDEKNIWICPNGGELSETVFRVGHIGNIKETDVYDLYEALQDVMG